MSRLVAILILLSAVVGTPTWAIAQQLVFITSTVHTGNLGGLAGGDAICNELAQGVGLPGAWVAWLSNAGINAGDRVQGGGPFVRTDGVRVAADRTALLSGTLEAPISKTETGAPFSITEGTWTGTEANGNRSGVTCQGWNTDSGQVRGTSGVAEFADSQWTAGGENPCSNLQSIYCFQQPLPVAQLPLFSDSMSYVALLLAAFVGGLAMLRRHAGDSPRA